MKTLYINLNGENIVSSNDVVVVGTEKDNIINKFYITLGTEICDGVIVKGVRKKQLVTEFENEHPQDFKSILDQWDEIRYKLLGNNPTGEYSIKIPNAYLEWLQYHQNSEYRRVYTQKYNKQRDVEINIDIQQLYEDTVELIISNVEPGEYKRLVIGDDFVTRKSAIVQTIKCNIPKISFSPLEEWDGDINDEDTKDKREFSHPESKIGLLNITELPLDCCVKGDKYLNSYEAKRAGLPLYGEGLLLIENTSTHKFGYINEYGQEMIPCTYAEAMPFSDGFAWVKKDSTEDGEWLIINSKGIVLTTIYPGYEIRQCNGSQVELVTGEFYSQNGDIIANGQNKASYENYSMSERGIDYYRNGHYSLIANKNVISATEDLIIVQSNGLFGVMNQVSGKIYVSYEYTKILYLGEYCFYLEKDSRHKYLAIINI